MTQPLILPSAYIAYGWRQDGFAGYRGRDGEVTSAPLGGSITNCWCYTGAVREAFDSDDRFPDKNRRWRTYLLTSLKVLETLVDDRIPEPVSTKIYDMETALQLWNDQEDTTQFDAFCLALDVENQLKEIL